MTTDHPDDPAYHEPHEAHGSTRLYLSVFVALCVLTGMSFFTYSALWPFHATPQIGWAFMIAISCTKAMLVILFFMHLIWEANWKYVLTVPAIFMSIFLTLMLVPDIGMRLRHATRERRLYMAVPEKVEQYNLEQVEHDEDEPAEGHADETH